MELNEKQMDNLAGLQELAEALDRTLSIKNVKPDILTDCIYCGNYDYHAIDCNKLVVVITIK